MNNNDLLKAVARYVIADGNQKELAKSRVEEILESLTPDLQTRERADAETTIRRMLMELGVPCHIKGHDRLVYAVRIVAENPAIAESITKWLYPEIAKEFSDTPSRVERAIRHAIETGFDRCAPDVIDRYFGNTVSYKKGKPTNSEYICRLAEIVREQM